MDPQVVEQKQGRVLMTLETSLVQPNPDQPRTFFDEAKLDLLGESIMETGQKDPITVRPLPNGTYMLIDGERRLRACEKKGIATIEAIVEYGVENGQLHLDSLILNFHSENHTHREVFQALCKEVNGGRTVKDLARALGKSEPWVYCYLSFRKLAPELQAMIEHDTRTDCLRYGEAILLARVEDHALQCSMYEAVKDLPPNQKKNKLKKMVGQEAKSKSGRKKSETTEAKRKLFSFFDRLSAGIEGVFDLSNKTFEKIVEKMDADEKKLRVDEIQECIENLEMLKEILEPK